MILGETVVLPEFFIGEASSKPTAKNPVDGVEVNVIGREQGLPSKLVRISNFNSLLAEELKGQSIYGFPGSWQVPLKGG